MTGISYLYVFVCGAALGSFANVAIYRWPRFFPLNLPQRSYCVHCLTKLKWYQNIPVLGYLLLRGRCLKCNSSIGVGTLVVEALSGFLCLAGFVRWGFSFEWVVYTIFNIGLIVATFVDLEFQIIPDQVSLGGVIVGVMASFWIEANVVGVPLSPIVSILGAIFGGGLFFALGELYFRWRGQDGLGMGDAKLLAMIGSFLGWRGAIGVVLLSSVVGAVMGSMVMLIQGKSMRTAIPFGPFLVIGALVMEFFGERVWLLLFPSVS